MFLHESSSAPDYVGIVYTSAKFSAGVTAISVNVGKDITAGVVDTVSKFFRLRRSSDIVVRRQVRVRNFESWPDTPNPPCPMAIPQLNENDKKTVCLK
jgi:hypothetical protein